MTDEERRRNGPPTWTTCSSTGASKTANWSTTAHGAYLTTDEDFGDFELLIDYKTVAEADSGIYLRGTPQVQIWDYTKEGGKWDLGADKGQRRPVEQQHRRPGQRSAGAGRQAVRRVEPLPHHPGRRAHHGLAQRQAGRRPRRHGELLGPQLSRCSRKGPIQLQTHGGEIRWRNIFLREIPARRGQRDAASSTAARASPVFNGKDFDGWAGAVDNYEVKDGAILCKPQQGRNDLHQGGIRRLRRAAGIPAAARRQQRPGDPLSRPGRPAYVGMCELQMLDTELSAVRQARPATVPRLGLRHGRRPRGLPAADRPVELQEVTVKGPDDQSRAERHRDPRRRPEQGHRIHGQLPIRQGPHRGHFGFAGHSDPVSSATSPSKSSIETKKVFTAEEPQRTRRKADYA